MRLLHCGHRSILLSPFPAKQTVGTMVPKELRRGEQWSKVNET
jgi:hypothetical protein